MFSKKISPFSRIPDYDNPHQMTTGLLEFSDEKCTRCLICTLICPARSILFDRDDKDWQKNLPYVDIIAPDVTLCVSCGCCLAACPSGAISIKRGFNAGFFFQRLTQAREMTYPRKY